MQLDLTTIGQICAIASPIVSIAGFLLIKFNDFRHLEKDVKVIYKILEKISNKTIDNDKEIAVLKQRVDDFSTK